MRALALGLTLALAATPVAAQHILEACRKAAHGDVDLDEPLIYQMGYCAGVVDAAYSHAKFLDRQHRFCPPVEATNKQALRIVLEFMEKRPTVQESDLHMITLLALQEAWPCR